MATYNGQTVYAMCRIGPVNRASDSTMNYTINIDFTMALPIVVDEGTPNPGPQTAESLIVNTSIEPTDSEISSTLRAGTAQGLNIRYPYGWVEADIRGLSL